MFNTGFRRAMLVSAAVLVAGAMAAPTTMAMGDFDLRVQLDMSGELANRLEPGDTLRVSLRPAAQYGQRTIAGKPIVLEKSWQPGMLLDEVRFDRAISTNTIYQIELEVIRQSKGKKAADSVRYLSALYKLPRTPVDKGIRMRLFQASEKDPRDTLVWVTQDADGVYRVQLFTA